ncbi:hypothetical protein C8Q70DRAFT_1053358 [Cubamyces menziesii]|nr:hypothetical protein C8Q70DRAFT_1053358 [Cubamyces menziesii]
MVGKFPDFKKKSKSGASGDPPAPGAGDAPPAPSASGSGAGDPQHAPSRDKGKQRASAAAPASPTAPASVAKTVLAEKPRTMALWPWEWRPEHSAVVHRQGCAICDAYLNHREVEAGLGLNGIRHAMDDMFQETRQAGYKDGYDHGYKAGREDAVVAHAAKAEPELNRLRMTVRHLQNRNSRLVKRVNLWRAVAGVQEADSDESGWDSYLEADDDDEADEPLKPLSEAEKQARLKRWHDRERRRWKEQVADVARLQAVLAASRSQLRPVRQYELRTLPLPGPIVTTADKHPSRAPRGELRHRRRRTRGDAHPARSITHAGVGASVSTARGRTTAVASRWNTTTGRPNTNDGTLPARSLPGAAVRGRAATSDNPGPARAPVPVAPLVPIPIDETDHRTGAVAVHARRAHTRTPTIATTTMHTTAMATVAVPTSLRLRAYHPAGPSTVAQTAHTAHNTTVLAAQQAPAPPALRKPTTVAEAQEIINYTQIDDDTGRRAVLKIKGWLKAIQVKGYQPNEVDRELLSFRVPEWYKEHFGENTRPNPRARVNMADPRPTDSYETWQQYVTARPEVLRRHVQRAPDGTFDEDTLRGYIWATQMATLGAHATATMKQRKNGKRIAFIQLATILQSPEKLATELQRAGAQPAATFQPQAYTGPLPPTLEEMARHVARCGISPDRLDVVLTKWAAHHLFEIGRADEEDQPDNIPIVTVEVAPETAEPSGSGSVAPLEHQEEQAEAPPEDAAPSTVPEVPEPQPDEVPMEDIVLG